MKKIISKLAFTVICTFIAISLSFVAFAATEFTETVDGIEYTYTVKDNKATLTNIDYEGFSEIHIPETLGGYEVTNLSYHIMSNVTYDEENGKEILATVYIPKTVTYIYTSAFFDNYAEKFVVDPENPAFCNDESGFLYTKDMTILYRMPQFSSVKEYTIPDSVTEIAGYAFNACDIEKLTFSKNLKYVGSQAFTYVHHLKKIELPDSVTSLSENAFIYCTGLEELKLSSSLTKIAGSAFSECYSLKKVIVPEGVKLIERYAFENDQALQEVYLPSTLTKIEHGAFGNCLPLKDICYAGDEESLKNITIDTDDYADDRETIIDKVNFHCDVPVDTYKDLKIDCQNDVLMIDGTGAIPSLSQGGWSYVKENYAATATSVIIGEDVDTVGSYFFEGFTELSHVIISSPAVKIEPNAFNDCASLRNVILFGESDFDATSFSNTGSQVNIFQPYGKNHTFTDSTDRLKAVKYSFSDGVLSFDGDVSLSTYDFFDNIAAFCLIYNDIASVEFSSLTFDNMQLYYLDDDFNLNEVEGNLIENCSIYPALSEDPDDAITFDELINGISDGSIDHFYLITVAENQADITVPEFQVIQEVLDFIVRALRWVVTLLDKLFAIINKFFK